MKTLKTSFVVSLALAASSAFAAPVGTPVTKSAVVQFGDANLAGFTMNSVGNLLAGDNVPSTIIITGTLTPGSSSTHAALKFPVTATQTVDLANNGPTVAIVKADGDPTKSIKVQLVIPDETVDPITGYVHSAASGTVNYDVHTFGKQNIRPGSYTITLTGSGYTT